MVISYPQNYPQMYITLGNIKKKKKKKYAIIHIAKKKR